MSLSETVGEFIHRLCAEPQDTLTRRLYEYVAALAEGDYELLSTACFLQWCQEAGGVIAEIGSMFDHCLASDEVMPRVVVPWTGVRLSAAAAYRARRCEEVVSFVSRRPGRSVRDYPSGGMFVAWRLSELLKDYPQ